jgi:hypothetical protein
VVHQRRSFVYPLNKAIGESDSKGKTMQELTVTMAIAILTYSISYSVYFIFYYNTGSSINQLGWSVQLLMFHRDCAASMVLFSNFRDVLA